MKQDHTSRRTFPKFEDHHPPLILLADDDPDDLEIFQSVLQEIAPDHRLELFPNGEVLLSFIRSLDTTQLPCLIVLDYNMPKMGGKRVLQELSLDRRYWKIPKVVFSTASSESQAASCMDNGAYCYKVKPGKFEELKKTLREILDYCHS